MFLILELLTAKSACAMVSQYVLLRPFLKLKRRYPVLYNVLLAVVIGLLGFLLGMSEIGFEINPELKISVDLREIVLIIGTFFVGHPLYVLISIALATLSEDLAGWDKIDFFMHLLPLLASYYVYRKLPALTTSSHVQGILWFGFIFIYYFILLLPALVLGYKLSGYRISLVDEYFSLSNNIIFELLATGLVTSLFVAYVSLFGRTSRLEAINKRMENRLHKRTRVIELQIKQMLRYAHMNSHELRAPLARILGLLEIMKIEKDALTQDALLRMLLTSGEELDRVVRKMNRLLEAEILEQGKADNPDGG